jgi:protein-S-isoprenylcysteine O-methyltransferase Ste14
VELILFVLVSGGLALLSRHSLARPRSHGFYRFLAWELLLVLVLLNWRFWFVQPFAPRQLASWVLLCGSIPLALAGARLLARRGATHGGARGEEPELFRFERTTSLVTDGIYRYIRHPLYSSLVILAFGLFFKDPSWLAGLLTLAATLALVATAKADEAECTRFFGPAYTDYMERTRMFVPFLF